MGKLKYYVLTSRNMHCLKRHLNFSGIPKSQLHVVINTLDKDYEKNAVNWCEENEIDYNITESDGTATTGKNSVLDLFLGSPNDYMVLIDGDDFLTPHGVWVYNHIAELEHTPDVVCLKNQFSVWPKQAAENEHQDPDEILGYEKRFFIAGDWADCMTGKVVDYMREAAELHDEEDLKFDPNKMYTDELKRTYAEWSRFNYFYIDGNETHSRVVFMSKVAAKLKFENKFKVGEDTLQYLLLKNMAINGDIIMYSIDETVPTYIYDQRIAGVSVNSTWENEGEGFLNWLKPLVEKYRELEDEGMLHESELDEFKPKYPPGYIPDVRGFGDWRIAWY